MIRQYNPQRFVFAALRAGNREKTVRVGTIPVGTIVYIDGRRTGVYRAPWIVMAWLPREIGAAAVVNGKYVNRMMAGGGHLAMVKSLRDGRITTVADHHLLAEFDE